MKTKKKKNRLGKIIKYFIITIVSICLLSSVAFGGIVLAMIKTAPALDLNSILVLDQPSILYDNKGQPMDEAPTLVKREVVAYKDIPENLKNAFISIEDERFESHNGIDIKRIAGSMFTDFKRILKSEDGFHGGSTITQQLLKNTILTNEVSIKRKVQEMYLATQLEKALSKDQILEAYLNTINLGGNIYGVQKAANQYFDKKVGDLSLIECAYIAGVTQYPYKYSYLSSYAKEHPKEYINRTKTVIAKMKENKKINEAQYTQAIKDLDDGKLVFKTPSSSQASNRLNFEWFSRPVMDQVKGDLMTNYHYTADEVEKLLMYGGLKIYTTMDRDLQVSAQNIMNDKKYFAGVQRGDINDLNNVVQPQSSAVVMDYHTGQVKVIIGGRGEQPANSYNRAASSKFKRPTGSSIKPLTVYSPAIDTKQATAGTVVEDSPLSAEIGKQWKDPATGKPYDPHNDEPVYRGYVTIREAIRRSINLVAVKLEYQIGLKTGLSYAEKYGIHFSNVDSSSISALALGQFDGANPLQMSAAYGTFGNSGVYTSPILYTKVVDKSGKVLLENKPATRKVLSPQAAYVMYDLLKGPTSGLSGATGSRAKFGAMPISGKTGTTSSKKDTWFCGLTPYLSGAVWIGNDKNEVLSGGISSNTAAQILGEIMKAAHKDLPVKDIDAPSGLVRVSICLDSGKQPSDLCARDPRGSRVVTELFIEGTQPTAICDTHVEAKVNKINGKLATVNTPAEDIESRVFIRRDYVPTKPLLDQQWVLPTENDDTLPAVNNPVPTNSGGNDPSSGGTTDTTGNENTNTGQDTGQQTTH